MWGTEKEHTVSHTLHASACTAVRGTSTWCTAGTDPILVELKSCQSAVGHRVAWSDCLAWLGSVYETYLALSDLPGSIRPIFGNRCMQAAWVFRRT